MNILQKNQAIARQLEESQAAEMTSRITDKEDRVCVAAARDGSVCSSGTVGDSSSYASESTGETASGIFIYLNNV